MNEVARANPVAPAQSFGEFLTRFATDPNITSDKLETLLKMRRELLGDEQREAYHLAYSQLSGEMPQVKKEGVVELMNKDGKRFGRYSFARWEDMDRVLRPLLAKHGFALSFSTEERDGNRLTVIGELMHAGGYSKTARMTLPPDTGPGRNSLQAVGSALSYGKRYVAEQLLNIVRQGEDDDGNTALDRTVTADQVAELAMLVDATKSDMAKFLKFAGAESLQAITQRSYTSLVNALKQKQHQAQRAAGNKKKAAAAP
jgi:hypothetical protein